MSEAIPTPDENNVWRLETNNASESWARSPYPDAPNKYFMVSADGHVQEPKDLWQTRMPEEYWPRLPGVEVMTTAPSFRKTEGFRPLRLRNIKYGRRRRAAQRLGRDPATRLDDLALDGVDAEILFPNLGLTMWATPDANSAR